MSKRTVHPFFYLILAVVFVASFMVVRPFMTAIILAFIAAIICKPIYDLLDPIFGKHSHATASLMTVTIVAITIILPVILLINATISQIGVFAISLNGSLKADAITLETTIETINEILAAIPYSQTQISPEGVVEFIQTTIRNGAIAIINNAASIGSSSLEVISRFIIFLVMLYVFISKQDQLLNLIRRLSPLDDAIDSLYINRVLSMMTSMIKGSFFVALIQGVIAGLLLWATGVPYSFFFTMIMVFLGILPLVGTGVVSIPIGIIQILTGQIWQGALVLIGSILIIANIDNVLRPYLVSKEASLSPAMIILGMFGGLRVYGVMGFLYGPVILILLTTTIQVYLEYKE